LSEITKEALVPVPTYVRQGPHLERWLEALDHQYERLKPYLPGCRAKSRQGVLLEIIRSEPPSGVMKTALAMYRMKTSNSLRGYARGLRTLEGIVEEENEKLFQISPFPNPEDPQFWRLTDKTHVVELLETIGSMRTKAAHATLMRFAQGDYHPFIQAETLNGMAHEGDHFDPKFVLNRTVTANLNSLMAYHGQYAMYCHNHRYRSQEYCAALFPFLRSPDTMTSMEVVEALRRKPLGMRMVKEFLAKGKDDPGVPRKLIEYIEKELGYR